MSTKRNQSGKEAIVIGASMAGLLAASVLNNYFERVTLIERDIFPAVGANRKGVQQGQHTHILLERGQKIMEAFLPGLTEELTEHGAVFMPDVSQKVRWFVKGSYHQPGVSGVAGVGVSRPMLEALVRKRVLALPNVQVRQGCDVKRLMTTADNGRVLGVHLVNRQGDNNSEERLEADLVIDAGGRGSRSLAWLEEMGYERPSEEEVRIDMSYTSCYYRRQPAHLPGLDGIVIFASPPDKRLGVMMAQDGNRWVLTIGGYLGQRAPTEYGGFLEAAKNLPTPDIYNTIKDAEPLGAPVAYTFPANLRRRYDKLARFPEGYLIIGDALCSFNPIYGQGMTVAAMEAKALGDCLENGRQGLSGRFFGEAAKIIDLSWDAAVGNDLNFPEVEGPRTPMVRFLNWYIDKIHLAAHHDSRVSVAFLKVINMVAAPPTILQLGIIWRVIRGNLGRDRGWAGFIGRGGGAR